MAARKTNRVLSKSPGGSREYIAVIGTPEWLGSESGAAEMLRELGADVRTLDARADPAHLIEARDEDLGIRPRAAVFEALDPSDRTAAVRRKLQRQFVCERVRTLLVVTPRQIARVDRAAGFDDFVVMPCSSVELYARVQALAWRPTGAPSEQVFRTGDLTVDPTAREARVAGNPVALTKKEFALLLELCEQRGRAPSRQALLGKVWGKRYAGGPRTVDIHVRRLRAKLGSSFELDTLRAWGYRLRIGLMQEGERPSAPPSATKPAAGPRHSH